MVTVQSIINKLIEPVGELTHTVDRLIAGDPRACVRKIAVTFNASYEVIQKAVYSKADMLITHEPTYYLHHDETDWMQGDAVYEEKRRLIELSGIAIYRLHDYVHRYEPDGILKGLLDRLAWTDFARHRSPHIVDLAPATVKEVAAYLRSRLPIHQIRLFGDPDLRVSTVGLSPGMSGGLKQIHMFMQFKPELLIVGETHEWETNEYVRDAVAMSEKKALLIIGHQASEEAGMNTMVDRLSSMFPSIQTFYLSDASCRFGPIYL